MSKQPDAIVEQQLKGRYILFMHNMYRPLFFIIFYDLSRLTKKDLLKKAAMFIKSCEALPF